MRGEVFFIKKKDDELESFEVLRRKRNRKKENRIRDYNAILEGIEKKEEIRERYKNLKYYYELVDTVASDDMIHKLENYYQLKPALEAMEKEEMTEEDYNVLITFCTSPDNGYYDWMSEKEFYQLKDEVKEHLKEEELKSMEKQIQKHQASVEDLNELYGNVYPGNMDLRYLTEAKDLEFKINEVEGSIDLSNLKKAENIEFPKEVENLDLSQLEETKGSIKFPEIVHGTLQLNKLSYINGMMIEFPEEIEGDLGLEHLKDGDDIMLSEKIRGNLYLNSLKRARGISFPEQVSNIYLNKLETTEDLGLPYEIEGDIYFGKETMITDLELPENFEGLIHIGEEKMTKEVFQKRYHTKKEII